VADAHRAAIEGGAAGIRVVAGECERALANFIERAAAGQNAGPCRPESVGVDGGGRAAQQCGIDRRGQCGAVGLDRSAAEIESVGAAAGVARVQAGAADLKCAAQEVVGAVAVSGEIEAGRSADPQRAARLVDGARTLAGRRSGVAIANDEAAGGRAVRVDDDKTGAADVQRAAAGRVGAGVSAEIAEAAHQIQAARADVVSAGAALIADVHAAAGHGDRAAGLVHGAGAAPVADLQCRLQGASGPAADVQRAAGHCHGAAAAGARSDGIVPDGGSARSELRRAPGDVQLAAVLCVVVQRNRAAAGLDDLPGIGGAMRGTGPDRVRTVHDNQSIGTDTDGAAALQIEIADRLAGAGDVEDGARLHEYA